MTNLFKKLTIPAVVAAGLLADQFTCNGKFGAEFLRAAGAHEMASTYKDVGQHLTGAMVNVERILGFSEGRLTR